MVQIITDSACDLPRDFIVANGLRVVPLKTVFGGEEYLDGVTLDGRGFYEKLIESDTLPTTSQPAPEDFAALYRQVRASGDSAVVVCLSSKLSGTFQSALIAADGYEDTVVLVDSLTVTIGEGALVEYAVRLRDAGLGAREIAAELERVKPRQRLIALLDTLEYLKRGGRISKTAAFAGGLLSIKPVVAIENGEVAILGKARGSKQGGNLLNKAASEHGGVDFSMPVRLGYSGLSDALLQKYVEDSRELWSHARETLPADIVGSAIGVHAGSDAIAVAFFSVEP